MADPAPVQYNPPLSPSVQAVPIVEKQNSGVLVLALIYVLIGLSIGGLSTFLIVKNNFDAQINSAALKAENSQLPVSADQQYVMTARVVYTLNARVSEIAKIGDVTELKTDLQEKDPNLQKFMLDNKTQYFLLGEPAKFTNTGEVIAGKEYYTRAKMSDLKQYQLVRVVLSKGLKSGQVKVDRVNIMHVLSKKTNTSSGEATDSGQMVDKQN